MARLVLFAIVVIAVVALVLYHGTQAFLRRQRQKELARYAPELLTYHDVPAPVAAYVAAQGEQLAEVARLIQAANEDPAVLIPSEYADPMEEWLANYKSTKRRLS